MVESPDLASAVADVSKVLDLVGVLGNAILGGLLARGHRFDPVGFAALAILSGLGGGMIRDALLQQGTVAALTDSTYILIAVLGAAIAFVLPVEGRLWETMFPWVDALSLGCWAVVGANKALFYGLGWLPAILLGVITAVGGGIVRDVVLRQVPSVFGGSTLYATSALAAAVVLIALTEAGLPTIGLIAGTLVGASLTLVARHRGWELPGAAEWPPGLARRMLPRPQWRRSGDGRTRRRGE